MTLHPNKDTPISDTPKISVITVCYNSATTISDTIRSVNNQTYSNIEHVFVDGGSADETLSTIKRESTRAKVLISEPDKGIYDAMNKGVNAATGHVICFLNSDDRFADESVLASVAEIFDTARTPFLYANIRLINSKGAIVRDWVVGNRSFRPQVFQPQIPHPGMFLSAARLRTLPGPFDASMKISADLKVQLQLVKSSDFPPAYLDRVVVHMRVGGASTGSFQGQFRGWVESARAWRDVHGGLGLLFVAQKVMRKLIQIRL